MRDEKIFKKRLKPFGKLFRLELRNNKTAHRRSIRNEKRKAEII